MSNVGVGNVEPESEIPEPESEVLPEGEMSENEPVGEGELGTTSEPLGEPEGSQPSWKVILPSVLALGGVVLGENTEN